MKSLNIDPNNAIATEPTSLLVDKVEFINFQGKANDLNPVIANITIIESLYSPTLLLEIGIKDQSNLIEDLPIIGQEKITIFAKRQGLGEDKATELQLSFLVTEIPTYARGENNNEQVYVIKGISEFAFNNAFKKISRSYREPPVTEIEKILVKDLLLDKNSFNVAGDDISKSKGVINIQRPLKAAEFFRNAAFDEKGSPFFLFQTLNGNVNFISLGKLVNEVENPEYGGGYYVTKTTNTPPGTESSYQQKRRNVINITSNLNLSKIRQARSGAFSSENNFLDWSNKRYLKKPFIQDTKFRETTLDGNMVFSPLVSVFDLPLNLLKEAHTEELSQNRQAYTGFDNYGGTIGKSIARKNAYYALMETFTHDIRLSGDLQLNAGRKIRINFPKAKDPGTLSDADLLDELISGVFIITSCAHVIEGGEYFCDLRIKRDSFSVDLHDDLETDLGENI